MARHIILLVGLMVYTVAIAEEQRNQMIVVKLTVPDAAWTITIDEVHRVENELWVISTVSRSPKMGAQVISTVQSSVTIQAPDIPEKHFILGKTWGWENDEPYIFMRDRKQIEKSLESGTRLYEKPTKDRKSQ